MINKRLTNDKKQTINKRLTNDSLERDIIMMVTGK